MNKKLAVLLVFFCAVPSLVSAETCYQPLPPEHVFLPESTSRSQAQAAESAYQAAAYRYTSQLSEYNSCVDRQNKSNADAEALRCVARTTDLTRYYYVPASGCQFVCSINAYKAMDNTCHINEPLPTAKDEPATTTTTQEIDRGTLLKMITDLTKQVMLLQAQLQSRLTIG